MESYHVQKQKEDRRAGVVDEQLHQGLQREVRRRGVGKALEDGISDERREDVVDPEGRNEGESVRPFRRGRRCHGWWQSEVLIFISGLSLSQLLRALPGGTTPFCGKFSSSSFVIGQDRK